MAGACHRQDKPLLSMSSWLFFSSEILRQEAPRGAEAIRGGALLDLARVLRTAGPRQCRGLRALSDGRCRRGRQVCPHLCPLKPIVGRRVGCLLTRLVATVGTRRVSAVASHRRSSRLFVQQGHSQEASWVSFLSLSTYALIPNQKFRPVVNSLPRLYRRTPSRASPG